MRRERDEIGPQPRCAATRTVDEFGLDTATTTGGPPGARGFGMKPMPSSRLIAFLMPNFQNSPSNVVGRVLRPDALDDVHRLDQHPVALLDVGDVEQLVVGRQAAGADAEQEAALAHVVELRDLRRDHRRMPVRQVDHAGAEDDAAGLRDQARHEHQRRRDRLGGGGEMLADEDLVEAEPLGQQHLLGGFGHIVASASASADAAAS